MGDCILDGCDKPGRSSGPSLCPMHYHRQYRHGSVDKHAPTSGVTVSFGRRYKTTYQPSHPLADKGGRVYVHRMVLYDTLGLGPHPCHWCDKELDWLPKGDERAIQVDHLNHLGDDNRPENLVPACGPCNTARGAQRKHQALLDAGWWSVHDTVANTKQGRRTAA